MMAADLLPHKCGPACRNADQGELLTNRRSPSAFAEMWGARYTVMGDAYAWIRRRKGEHTP
jgi:hypothetical protein